MGKLDGKIALVTGGNSGIGLATAKQFVNEGAYVFITEQRKPELDAAVKEIGRNVTGVQGDVSNLGDLNRLFSRDARAHVLLHLLFEMELQLVVELVFDDPPPEQRSQTVRQIAEHIAPPTPFPAPGPPLR